VKRLLSCILAAGLVGCPPPAPSYQAASGPSAQEVNARPPKPPAKLLPNELKNAQEDLKRREAEYFRQLHGRINGPQNMTVTQDGIAYPVYWESVPFPGLSHVYRTRTPEGWLVLGERANNGMALIYVPDPTNSWAWDLKRDQAPLPEKQ
jgi:hypothetical protein